MGSGLGDPRLVSGQREVRPPPGRTRWSRPSGVPPFKALPSFVVRILFSTSTAPGKDPRRLTPAQGPLLGVGGDGTDRWLPG